MNGHPLHDVFEATFAGEDLHESRVPQGSQQVQGNAASQIDPARRQNFQSKIPRLARKDRYEDFDGGPVQFTLISHVKPTFNYGFGAILG